MLRSIATDHRSDSYELAVLGTVGSAAEQLIARVETTCHALGSRLHVHRVTDVTELTNQHPDPDRIILSADTRLKYPVTEIDWLTRSELGVPWGVVTSTLWSGSRRTGLGASQHWQLPWYRWWDAWYAWFFPQQARSQSIVDNAYASPVAPIDLATPGRTSPRRAGLPTNAESHHGCVAIVSQCSQTRDALSLMALQVQWSALHCRSAAEVPGIEPVPTCVVIDGTSLDYWRRQLDEDFIVRECAWLAERLPSTRIVYALTQAQLDLWPRFKSAGADDFFVLPSFNLPLANYLAAMHAGSIRTVES